MKEQSSTGTTEENARAGRDEFNPSSQSDLPAEDIAAGETKAAEVAELPDGTTGTAAPDGKEAIAEAPAAPVTEAAAMPSAEVEEPAAGESVEELVAALQPEEATAAETAAVAAAVAAPAAAEAPVAASAAEAVPSAAPRRLAHPQIAPAGARPVIAQPLMPQTEGPVTEAAAPSELPPEKVQMKSEAAQGPAEAPKTTVEAPKAAVAPQKKAQENKAPRKVKKPSLAARSESGPADKCFNGLSWIGLPLLMALTVLLLVPQYFHPRSLWMLDEIRYADIYARFLSGDTLALSLNGAPFMDMSPLYFWYLKGLDLIPMVDGPLLFLAATALAGVLFISSVWLLARATGHDRRAAFAAGLMALCTFAFMGFAQVHSAWMLFAALVVLALTCFYRGWCKRCAPIWLTLAFLFTGAATLIGGPLAVIFPLMSSILFLFWRWTPGRLNGRDGLLGFLFMLLLIAAWPVMLYISGDIDYIIDIFKNQPVDMVLGHADSLRPWYFYLLLLPFICLPWTLLPLFVNWWGALRGIPAAFRIRKEKGGSSWLWITLVSGVALLSVLGTKCALFMLPLLAPLAVLCARSLLRLTPHRSRFYFFWTSLFLLIAGLVLVAANYHDKVLPLIPAEWMARLGDAQPVLMVWLDAARHLDYAAAPLIVASILVLFLCRRSLPGGALLLTVTGLLAMTGVGAYYTLPSLDALLTPRAPSEAMAAFVRDGGKAATYKVSPAACTYYLNSALTEEGKRPDRSVTAAADMAALDKLAADHGKLMLLMPEKEWNNWASRPASMQEVNKQWIVCKSYVLASQSDATAAEKPAAPAAEELTEKPEAPADKAAEVKESPEAPVESSAAVQEKPEAPAENAVEVKATPEAPALPAEEATAAEKPAAEVQPASQTEALEAAPAAAAQEEKAEEKSADTKDEAPVEAAPAAPSGEEAAAAGSSAPETAGDTAKSAE